MSHVYMRVYSGRGINPFEIQLGDITLKDIAHHLSLINRFNGTTRYPINVAQHSVYVARLVVAKLTKINTQRRNAQSLNTYISSLYTDSEIRMAGLYGLLHDASEAYLGDVTKWVKGHPGMSWFREQEEILQRRVYEEFFLSPTPPKEISDLVDWADRVMVRFEGSSSYGHGPKFMKTLHDACGEERAKTHYPELTAEELEMVGAWKPWSWQQSEESFIVHHRMYSRS